jgi:hypothetical protein
VLAVNDVSAQTERRWTFQCADHEAIFVADVGKEITGFMGHKGWGPAQFKRVDMAAWATALLDRFLSAGVSTGAADAPLDLTCVPQDAPKTDEIRQ